MKTKHSMLPEPVGDAQKGGFTATRVDTPPKPNGTTAAYIGDYSNRGFFAGVNRETRPRVALTPC